MKLFISILCFFVFIISCSEHTVVKSSYEKTDSIKPALEIYSVADTALLPDDDWGHMVKYGMQLINRTAYYIGPKGVVSENLGNRMNCTNCHLDNGTKPYGLNFFNSHKTYPQYRARENKILSMADRVNNCIERPHSGKALALDSKEMIAIISYIKWVGESYDLSKHEGYGLKKIQYANLKADPKNGETVYVKHCATCHQANGEGQMNAENTTYINPPLWGKKSYQEASSMHRVLKAASFIKYNMPNKVTWQKPTLTDQEALDVAAFINDGRIHERPKAGGGISYENINTKPVDYFKGPYLDSFSEEQHAFGPWNEIENFYKEKGLKIH